MRTTSKFALTLLVGVAIGALAMKALNAQARSPAYVINEFEIIDEAAFKEFTPKVEESVRAAGGKFLTRGSGQIIPLDGQAPKRVNMQVYESLEKAQAWRAGAAWKDLTPLREKALKIRAYIVEGIAN
jgi:uncharacterized protein (DUF1330 family)